MITLRVAGEDDAAGGEDGPAVELHDPRPRAVMDPFEADGAQTPRGPAVEILQGGLDGGRQLLRRPAAEHEVVAAAGDALHQRLAVRTGEQGARVAGGDSLLGPPRGAG